MMYSKKETLAFLDGLKELVKKDEIEIGTVKFKQGTETLPPPVDDQFIQWKEMMPNGHKTLIINWTDLNLLEKLEKEKAKRL